jgi:putative FmdB family regulatory protein
MAVYEFDCQTCGERFEVMMGISERCPQPGQADSS